MEYIEEYDGVEISYSKPKIITCACGTDVWLDQVWYGNDCDGCGRIYNSSGQRLLPRNMWEEYENDGDCSTIAERLGGY